MSDTGPSTINAFLADLPPEVIEQVRTKAMGRKISTTVYITPEQAVALDLLVVSSRISKAEHIRRGIDLALQEAMHLGLFVTKTAPVLLAADNLRPIKEDHDR